MEVKIQSRKYGKFIFGDLTDKIIELAIRVHKKLGPGFIESVYEKAIAFELRKCGISFTKQAVIKVYYEDIPLGNQRLDFIVEDKIIIELKAVSELNSIHHAQMISYLKATGKQVGLLLNFAKPVLEIKRIMN